MKRTALLILPLVAGACGLREPLQPVEGATAAPAPAAMDRPLTTDELLAQPVIARPQRVDELLRRSEEREDDHFDLPPPDVPAGTIPVPEDSEGPR
ncbi:hypothetical protein RCO27_06325 [Sphingosinicella sp. LHD-64]|uniref:hypothetical protein n=1 Tax=Sphingosinicella sp. LHD-64 TaxID=3072139 RepID=UPI00280E7049|nr:hypothetical protein [Sphingosinicella sp. LHD-64]MDQ8755841.1 hypothetical protein [Sphingosinicella sp. LHD-64]